MGRCCKAGNPFAHARRCCQMAQVSADMIFSQHYFIILNDSPNNGYLEKV
jgi:hypothetical protein